MGKSRQGGEPTAQEKEWQEGMATHENIIFSRLGGLSNTVATSALARLEVVRELGLEKVAFGCLPSLQLKVEPVIGKTKAARKLVTVDGCPFECARKTVEAGGSEITKSIVLARDIGMKKVVLHTDIGESLGNSRPISLKGGQRGQKDLLRRLFSRIEAGYRGYSIT